MEDRLLRYYEHELTFLRKMGQEFAQEYPNVAGSLQLEAGKGEDPHVERLLQGFALIAARIHHKLDDEFPEITTALLNLLYPHFLAPLPSMSIVQFVPDPMQGNRLNEGKCDSRGRFWAGSMQTNLNPDGSGREMDRSSGALFRIDGDGTTSRHSEFEFGISNTMAWSPDNRTFYFGDSIRNVIFTYDFDIDDGVLSNRRVLIEGYPHGAPDGSAMDADGCLWNSRFGGSRLIRITPDGKIDREIPLPVTNPTSCTFGGRDNSTLFVTSATFTLSDEQLAENPHEGTLLAAEIDTVGLRDQRFQRAV